MANTYVDPQSSIIWVDSDPNICYSIGLIRAQNWHVACFNETADALNALHERRLEPSNITCVITSMMERGGRRQRGLLNGREILTADVQKCKEHGADIFVLGGHNDLQIQVIDQLNKRLNSTQCKSVILIGIAGPSGCGKTTYAKHIADYLHSPFLPISLDNFFTSPIDIDHHILGCVKSLEDPASININGFLTLLRQIKSDWESAPLRRSNVVMQKNKTIYIVVEGFLLFALSNDVTSMFDIRIFLDSTQARCRMQRFRRKTRVDPKVHDSQVAITDDFSRWYDNLVWAEYLKRRDVQMASAEKVFTSEEYQNCDYVKLDAYINKRCEEIV